MFSTLTSTLILALTTLRPHPVSGAAVSRQAGSVKEVTLDIGNTDLAPDGFLRSTVVANGQYPGPLITAKKGDTLRVTVNNQLVDPTMRRSTTLDFDGVFFETPNDYNEGSSFVTTCPIVPGASYVYDVPLTNQSGTFWYHSQLSVQYVDGLRGPLIVYDDEDPQKDLYDIDDESTIIQIGDWWHNTTLPLLAGYVATGVVPISDSGTFNGKGRFNGGPAVPFGVTPVTPGKRHRLRIINESARNVFNISIDSHNMTVIEADGVPTEPLVVDTLELLAGQRYSVIVEANQEVGNYWINAPFTGGNAALNPNQNATLSRGILRYAGAPDEDPAVFTTFPTNPVAPFVEGNLAPLINDFPTEDPDVSISLSLAVTAGKAIWNVNNVSYLSPETPTLVKVLNGANSSSDFNVTENTFILPARSMIEVEFPPTDDDDAHPFHLHGNNFWLVKSSSTGIVNTVNPIKRDTAGVGGPGMIVRFRTDVPQVSFFHCHIFWHLQAGLATVMASGLDDVRAQVDPDADWEQLCPAYAALDPSLQ